MKMSLLYTRKISSIFVSIILTFQLTGCWSSIELNRRAFVRIMLVDLTDHGIELTLGLPLPNRISSGNTTGGSSGGSNQKTYTYISKTGNSIGEAYRKLQMDLPREITFGQLRNIILGQRFAESKEEMIGFADFMTREALIHINGNLFVTQTTAKNFAPIPAIFENFPSVILTNYGLNKNTLNTSIKDMLMSFYAGGDFLLPQLVFSKIAPAGEQSKEDWLGTSGAAVFSGGRWNGNIDVDQTRAIMWLLQKEEGIEFNINSPTDGKVVSMLLRTDHSNIKPIVKGPEMSFIVLCSIKGSIISTESTIDLSDPEQLGWLEEELSSSIEDKLKAAFQQFRKLRSDPLQLGSYMKWHHPKLWNTVKADWREKLGEEITVNSEVQATIELNGTVKKQHWDQFLSKESER